MRTSILLLLVLVFASCRDNSIVPRDEVVTVYFTTDPQPKEYNITVTERNGSKESSTRTAKVRAEKSFFRSVGEIHFDLRNHFLNVDSITYKDRTVILKGKDFTKHIGRF